MSSSGHGGGAAWGGAGGARVGGGGLPMGLRALRSSGLGCHGQGSFCWRMSVRPRIQSVSQQRQLGLLGRRMGGCRQGFAAVGRRGRQRLRRRPGTSVRYAWFRIQCRRRSRGAVLQLRLELRRGASKGECANRCLRCLRAGHLRLSGGVHGGVHGARRQPE